MPEIVKALLTFKLFKLSERSGIQQWDNLRGVFLNLEHETELNSGRETDDMIRVPSVPRFQLRELSSATISFLLSPAMEDLLPAVVTLQVSSCSGSSQVSSETFKLKLRPSEF